MSCEQAKLALATNYWTNYLTLKNKITIITDNGGEGLLSPLRNTYALVSTLVCAFSHWCLSSTFRTPRGLLEVLPIRDSSTPSIDGPLAPSQPSSDFSLDTSVLQQIWKKIQTLICYSWLKVLSSHLKRSWDFKNLNKCLEDIFEPKIIFKDITRKSLYYRTGKVTKIILSFRSRRCFFVAKLMCHR